MHTRYFSDGSADKEFACNAGFHLWVGTIPWRRKWQPIPVFLPEISHGQRSLAGYNPKGLREVGHGWVTKHDMNTTKVLLMHELSNNITQIYLLFGCQKWLPRYPTFHLPYSVSLSLPLKNKLIQQMVRGITVLHETRSASSF